jgi:hypothetical protein
MDPDAVSVRGVMSVMDVIASLVIPARKGHVFLVSGSKFREDGFMSMKIILWTYAKDFNDSGFCQTLNWG